MSSPAAVLTFLGCGKLGTALLQGLLSAFAADPEKQQTLANSLLTSSIHGNPPPNINNESRDEIPACDLRLILCVRREESAKRLRAITTTAASKIKISVLVNNNLQGVQESNAVFLCCEPKAAPALLRADGIYEALQGKVLVSTLGGVTIENLQTNLLNGNTGASCQEKNGCMIVRVSPSVAARVGASMTVIDSNFPRAAVELIETLFPLLGHIKYVPEHLMNASTALCASGPAFIASVLQAMVDSSMNLGISREAAVEMATLTMEGAVRLVLGGEDPACLRDRVSTPGGATEKGLLVMESVDTEGGVAKALEATTAAIENVKI